MRRPAPTPVFESIQPSSESREPFWAIPDNALLEKLGTTLEGLTTEEATQRLQIFGINAPRPPAHSSGFWSLLRQAANPIVLLLIAATLISLILGDIVDALIILAIILASGLLSFWRERGASNAVAALQARVAVDVEVRRDGNLVTLPFGTIVPGDVIVLNAGDVIPGDGRLLSADSLQVDEAPLTGEAYPVEKKPAILPRIVPLNLRSNAVFMGSHVVSGSGTAVIVETGARTELGAVSTELTRRSPATSFERGVTGFGYLLVRATILLVIAIFIVNLVLDRTLVESLLFSLALAVGLTPQLLPAIVAVSLSTGARRMAKEQVIVKRLDTIEDFGSMTILCTDKTGTITAGTVSLTAALDPTGRPDESAFRLAWLNAHLQTGYSNPLDDAILQSARTEIRPAERLDEVPYDFSRKRLSVLVRDTTDTILITKGAYDKVIAVCAYAMVGETTRPLQSIRPQIDEQFRRLSDAGYRVLGLATRAMMQRASCTSVDEAGMTFAGFLVFADPPKSGADKAIEELANLGISVRMITGDNRRVAAFAAASVGLSTARVLTGEEINGLDDQELWSAARSVAVFAEVEPVQKERIVRALQGHGEVVGFLGDGINDAPALHAADVGISVDTAVDVAKQSAAIVLLDKHLAVIADGVRLGRATFANTLKYINVTTSANFGNMLSMAVAAAFLPFLPLLPRQILLLNFLSDIPGTTIATDRVDSEQLARPQAWDIAAIRSFMIVFGLISSIFDISTFIVLRLVFGASADLFRSGWFVESILTELAVLLVLRTKRPFVRSRPGTGLLVASAAMAILALSLPFGPFAAELGFVSLSGPILVTLGSITCLYVAATECAKRFISPPRTSRT